MSSPPSQMIKCGSSTVFRESSSTLFPIEEETDSSQLAIKVSSKNPETQKEKSRFAVKQPKDVSQYINAENTNQPNESSISGLLRVNSKSKMDDSERLEFLIVENERISDQLFENLIIHKEEMKKIENEHKELLTKIDSLESQLYINMESEDDDQSF